MTTQNAWLLARENAQKTQRDADYEVRSTLPRRYWITPSKLSRLENGLPTEMTPIELGVLARFYGKTLEEIDPSAAEELTRVQGVLDDLAGRRRKKYAPRDSNPEPADSGRIGHSTEPMEPLLNSSTSRAA